MIDGNVAEKEGLQAVSNERTSLGRISGGQVESEYGVFRFNLGPGDKEKYHEVMAVGMNEITNEFHKYDLKQINREYLKYADEDERKKVLPKTVVGSKVHLLLGIKNTSFQPVLMKVLPSGVGVYLSPFKDVNGSRIIYAGPSKWFTRTDNDCIQNSNYAIYSVFGTNVGDEVGNSNDDLDCKVVELIDTNEILKPGPKLIETPDNELDTDF